MNAEQRMTSTTESATSTEPACSLDCGPGGNCLIEKSRDESREQTESDLKESGAFGAKERQVYSGQRCQCPLGRSGDRCQNGEWFLSRLMSLFVAPSRDLARTGELSISVAMICLHEKWLSHLLLYTVEKNPYNFTMECIMQNSFLYIHKYDIWQACIVKISKFENFGKYLTKHVFNWVVCKTVPRSEVEVS